MEPPIIAAIIGGCVAVSIACITIAYNLWRSRREKRIETGKVLRASFDNAITAVKDYNGELCTRLIDTLTEYFPAQRKAAHEFRLYLSGYELIRFNRAWKAYHSDDEDNPDFVQYAVSPNIKTFYLEQVHKILQFTEKT